MITDLSTYCRIYEYSSVGSRGVEGAQWPVLNNSRLEHSSSSSPWGRGAADVKTSRHPLLVVEMTGPVISRQSSVVSRHGVISKNSYDGTTVFHPRRSPPRARPIFT